MRQWHVVSAKVGHCKRQWHVVSAKVGHCKPARTTPTALPKTCDISYRSSSVQRRSGHLEERVVGTAEHSPGLAEGVLLAGAHLPAHVEVLQQPVALHVEVVDVLE